MNITNGQEIARDRWNYVDNEATLAGSMPYADHDVFEKAVKTVLTDGRNGAEAFLMWQLKYDDTLEAIVNVSTPRAQKFVDVLNKGGFRNCVATKTEQPPHIFIPIQD